MSDIKLFSIQGKKATELASSSHELEKPLQQLFEDNLDTLLRVHFLATEFETKGKTHSGRIDTLGIDENHCPVILEYKRHKDQNVLTQGLFYLDWLLEHQADFELLVMQKLGKERAAKIDWSAPRLICVAWDYNKFDEHAANQINRNIDLIRYKRFGDGLLALELAKTVTSTGPPVSHEDEIARKKQKGSDKPMTEILDAMSNDLKGLYQEICDYMLGLGDDVSQKQLKLYTAFRKIRNFATVTAQQKNVRLYLHLDPGTVDLEEGYTRDVTKIGTWGTGNLEVLLNNQADFQKAIPLIQRAYEEQ